MIFKGKDFSISRCIKSVFVYLSGYYNLQTSPMKPTPISEELVNQTFKKLKINDFGKVTIREMVALSARLQQKSGQEFIRMEMGVPGLPPASIGVQAEIEALQNGAASIYPVLDGNPELKLQASRFIKAFVDLDIDPLGCIPVVGSMQGCFISTLISGQCDPQKDTILFIDPGFPVLKQQVTVLGYKLASFDVYDCRGAALQSKLESFLDKGNIAAILYSNPNNPSWVCFTEEELAIIGQLASHYDAIVVEDMAYFAMDFRKDLSIPFQTPYAPSVGRYTDKYILLLSASKVFSYAGQRIAIAAISDKLYQRTYPALTERYGSGTFGSIFVHRIFYSITAGTSNSAQYALTALFKAANEGAFNILQDVRTYGQRAARLKEIFLKHGFHLVYAEDMGNALADGFYFTIGYKNMSGDELMKELVYYGVTAISLTSTGSLQQGLRACTSFIQDHQYDVLDQRLAIFAENHSS